MKSNIVYQYYKKQEGDETIYIQFDPLQGKGSHLIVQKNGNIETENVEFGPNIIQELEENEYIPVSPLEFHLILKGLA